MAANKGQGGIQMLLTAEQEAQQIVASARNMKIKRLKQAKEEADREAANYRLQLEKEYQRKVSDSSGFSGSTVKRLDEETERNIKNLKSATDGISADVVGMLMKYVKTIKTNKT